MHLDLYKITHKKFDRWEYYFLCVITIFNTENITTNMSTTLNNTMELLIQSQMENFVEKLSDDTKRTRPIDLILGMHAKSSANEHRGKRISCIEQKICTKCDTSVNTSILHELELKEFNISGLCESCQNHFFRSDKQEPTTQNSSISMSISSPVGDVRMDETKEPHTEDVPIPSDELLNDSVGFMEFLNQNVYDEQPMDEHHVIMLGEAEQAMVFAEEALLLARENYAKAKKIKKSTDRMVVKAHMKSLIDSEKITQEDQFIEN